MNRIAIILLASTFVSTLLGQTTTIVFPNTNLPSLPNANLPTNYLSLPANLPNPVVRLPDDSKPVNPATAVHLSTNPTANPNDFRASVPIVNTNELWRMLSKLRIGSFFTSRAIKCECPSASQPATLIPIPVVERIHHHYDKKTANDALNRLRAGRATNDLKSALDGKTLTDIRNLIDTKTGYDLKYSYDPKYDLKYPYDARNVRNFNDFKSSETVKQTGLAEAPSQKDLDKARFGELSDLISDNGQRSITSVRAPSFGNQQSPAGLEEALGQSLLLNAGVMREQIANDPLLREQLLREQLRADALAKDRSAAKHLQALAGKDELADNSAWLDENLNALNNPDKQSPVSTDLEGRLDIQNGFNPSRTMNEIVRLLVNELEPGDSTRQRDLSGSYASKTRIFRLLGDLERFVAQNEKWSADRRLPTDYRPPIDYRLLADARRLSGGGRRPSSRIREDLLANSLASGLLNNPANETAADRFFAQTKNKKGRLSGKPNDSEDWAEEDSEYFSDTADYLPSESVAKFSADLPFSNRTPETDFYPIADPVSFFRLSKERKRRKRTDDQVL